MKNSENIFLIGYRGSGKTTVARLLGEQLGRAWLDADALLEERHGRSVRALFDLEGEAGFRDREAALLEELCDSSGRIIATGGGVVLRPANRERLRAAGRVIWLTADPQTLWQRLQGDATSADRRPMLTVGGLAEIEELLRLREPLYRSCAHWVIETANRSPADVAAAIAAWLESASGGQPPLGEIPNSKSQIPNNTQAPRKNPKRPLGGLGFRIWPWFGIWNLRCGISRAAGERVP